MSSTVLSWAHDAIGRIKKILLGQGFQQLKQLLQVCQQSDTVSQGGLVLDELPQDILHHIHSLLPLRDAARAACVSHGFLHSWRCYSSLTLNTQTLGLTHEKLGSEKEIEIHLIDKVDRILNNHRGVALKTLKLDLFPCDSISASYLDRWLQTSVKPGIEEVSLVVSTFMEKDYDFPCSVLSDDTAARSIQSLHLYGCAFHPTVTLGWLRRLQILCLYFLKINDEGLGHLLSKSFACLEQLEIGYCQEITCLKMPFKLQKLMFLSVKSCPMIRLVEINAPKLSSFKYEGTQVEINVIDSTRLKDVQMSHTKPFGVLSSAYAKLTSIAPNVGSLTLCCSNENFNTPMLAVKFLHLKKMDIRLLRSSLALWPICDLFSLIPYLHAAPALESFILRVDKAGAGHDSVVAVGDDELRRKPECRHDRLRRVMVTGFCSTISMVEFTRHILEHAPSLELLKLDTTISCRRRFQTWHAIEEYPASQVIRGCWPMCTAALAKAQRATEAASRYIEGRVPSAVEYTILKPCIQCIKQTRD
uniref:Uncharacterized protein n=1 Tax=Avena sativa TaxID=4498 RepID=A0ACD5YYX8_AVESA